MRSETDMVAAAGTARLMLESPLVGVADLLRAQEGASTRFALRERAFLDLVNVRGEPSDAAFVEAVAAVAGLRLPAEPNTVARGERYDALWLGPDEWLLRSVEPAPAGGLHARLSSALAGADAAAVDVGSGYTVLEISGAQAREALARGCPLDLHPRVFKTGQCAQSHFQDGDRARTHGRRAHGSGRAPQLRRLFLSHPARRRGALARMNSLRDAPRDVLDDADARAWARGWTVFVDGYTVAARIGLYPHEHLAPQPIVIDARLGCLGEPDEDGVWIDYDGFCARVAAFLPAGRIPGCSKPWWRTWRRCRSRPGPRWAR